MKVSEWLTLKASLWTDRLDCLCFRRLLFVQTSQFTFLFLSTIFRVYKPYLKFSDELNWSNVDRGPLTAVVRCGERHTCLPVVQSTNSDSSLLRNIWREETEILLFVPPNERICHESQYIARATEPEKKRCDLPLLLLEYCFHSVTCIVFQDPSHKKTLIYIQCK